MATQVTVVTFTALEPLDGDFPYVDVEIETPYSDADAYATFFGKSISDGGGAVDVWIKDGTLAADGFRLLASAPFEGTVFLIHVDKP